MAKPFAKKFYSTTTWYRCRNDYAAYRGHLCERCLRRGVLTHGEIVHHKIELTPENIDDPDISLNWNNLELLCRFCHAEVHDRRKNSRRFSIGPDGEIFIETPPEPDENYPVRTDAESSAVLPSVHEHHKRALRIVQDLIDDKTK